MLLTRCSKDYHFGDHCPITESKLAKGQVLHFKDFFSFGIIKLQKMGSTWRWKTAQNMEIKWWKRYLKGKDPVEYLAWKSDYWKKFLESCNIPFEQLTGKKVMDAGCGPAGIFTILKQSEVFAFDPLLSSYENLEHFKPNNYPAVRFKEGRLEAIPSEEAFDYIFCLNAINHVQDIALCYDQLFARLKKGGTMIVSIDAHNWKFFKGLFRLIPGDILHPHQFDLKEYRSFLTQRGGSLLLEKKIKKEFFFDYWVQVVKT